jgi:hypothetical protein
MTNVWNARRRSCDSLPHAKYASGVGRLFWIVGVEDALLFGDAR